MKGRCVIDAGGGGGALTPHVGRYMCRGKVKNGGGGGLRN